MGAVLVVVGVGLVVVGLLMGWQGRASVGAGGGVGSRIRVDGPAWLIVCALGVGVVVFGAVSFPDATRGPETPPDGLVGFDDGDIPDPLVWTPYSYGDDPWLDSLQDLCQAGDMTACDTLYWDSPVDSDYEWVAATCNGTRTFLDGDPCP